MRFDKMRLSAMGHELSMLCLNVGHELRKYKRGEATDFKHTKELSETLKEYQLEDTHTITNWPHFQYYNLWRGMMKISKKEIRDVSELALEMKLLRYELEDIENLPKERLQTLHTFVISAAGEFMMDPNREILMRYRSEHPYKRYVG